MSGNQLKSLRCVRFRLHGRKPCRWLPRKKVYWFVSFRNLEFHLCSIPRHGIHVFGVTDRAEVTPSLYRPLIEFGRPSVAIRKRSETPKAGKHLAAMETELFRTLLPLSEHCSHREYEDGSPREPGWFTIKTNGAAWCIQVKDPDTACSFTAVGDTIDKALETAALLLACDEAPWEPDTWLAQAKAKKKK